MEISIEAPGEFAEPLSGLFSKHSGGSIAVEQRGGYNPDEGESPPGPDTPVIVRAWLPVDATLDDRLASIDLGVRLISHLRELPPVQKREVIEAEWRRQSFEPVRVGTRLLIMPANATREAAEAPGADVIIPLEPGLAFGTGHHPTTRACLEVLERIIKGGESVVDIGCGSGILTVAALKLGARNAVCLDIDPDAVRATRRNLRRAGVSRKAKILQGSVPHPDVPPRGFDVVLANISARILIEQAVPMLECLNDRGRFIGSGYMVERQEEVHRALRDAGADTGEAIVRSDWVTVVARRSPG
ncbi:MAG: 50S ribosomal protein L11 methyltransferase [Chloroflexi bacterium]|nr:50S ribosomal protein L11 methyltransferase [Chloroflexota bacterium]